MNDPFGAVDDRCMSVRNKRLFSVLLLGIAALAGVGGLAAPDLTAVAAPTSAAAPAAIAAQAPRPLAAASLGINLAPVKDWSTEIPFVDVFIPSRAWIPSAVGSGEWDSGVFVPVDAQGWPLEVPFDNGVDPPQEMKTLLMNALGYAWATGTYTIIFEGDGTLWVDADTAFGVFEGGGRYELDIDESVDFGIILTIQRSNPADPVRNIRVILPGFADTYEAQPFNPVFLDRIRDFSVLRFSEWTEIQGQPLVRWQDRPLLSDAQQSSQSGVAYEWMIRLANTVDSDAWLTVPHMADDNFVRELARLWSRDLEADRRLFLEYSNEPWSPDAVEFPQSAWLQARGLALGLDANDAFLAGVRFQAKRSAEIFTIFEEEFGADAGRVVNVLNSWIAEPAVSEDLLTTFALAELNGVSINPSGVRVDALAVAPYFGYSIGTDILNDGELGTATPADVLDRSEAYVRGELTDLLVSHKAVADAAGVPLISYEGGQHLTANGPNVFNDELVALLTAANRDQRMHAVYQLLFDVWDAVGGGLFIAYSSVTRPGMFGAFGALEYIDQPIAEAPKYRALVDRLAQIGGGAAATPEPAADEDSVALPRGMSLFGWFGAPTTSARLLAEYPSIEAIWWLNPLTGAWISDSRALPSSLRPLIAIRRGSGLLAVTSAATEVGVPRCRRRCGR